MIRAIREFWTGFKRGFAQSVARGRAARVSAGKIPALREDPAGFAQGIADGYWESYGAPMDRLQADRLEAEAALRLESQRLADLELRRRDPELEAVITGWTLALSRLCEVAVAAKRVDNITAPGNVAEHLQPPKPLAQASADLDEASSSFSHASQRLHRELARLNDDALNEAMSFWMASMWDVIRHSGDLQAAETKEHA